MRALVVYESMFGNTETVAKEVAAGLAGLGEVVLVDVDVAPTDVTPYDLVVVGGPTHAFSMSRAGTRADAVKQGAPRPRVRGIREWIDQLGEVRVPVAAFDTRVDKVRRLPGSAAKKAAKSLKAHGSSVAERPQSFYVVDTPGPLLDGERERARRWGASLVGG